VVDLGVLGPNGVESVEWSLVIENSPCLEDFPRDSNGGAIDNMSEVNKWRHVPEVRVFTHNPDPPEIKRTFERFWRAVGVNDVISWPNRLEHGFFPVQKVGGT